MNFHDIVTLTQDRISRFEAIEQRGWGAEGCVIELAKQVGELSKWVLIKERYYFPGHATSGADLTEVENIADELADILFVVIRLAKHYEINLIDAQLAARQKEDDFLRSRSI